MLSLRNYIQTTPNFWESCEAEFDDPTIPDVEGQIRIEMGDQTGDKYLRLLGTLLTYSEDQGGVILGYAEIAYYTIKRVSARSGLRQEIWVNQSDTKQIRIIFYETDVFDLWWNALIKICVVKNADFQLGALIGKGGFAKVYLTTDGCAAKLIKKAKINGSVGLQSLKSEIELHRSMDHDFITKLHSVHDIGNAYILKMDYFQGKRLSEVAKNGQLAEKQIKNVMQQLLEALAYMHSKNVVHCDFTSHNILISDSFQIKVIDFGLSMKATSKFRERGGTPGYIPPELWDIDDKFSTNWDIFSLGAIFYELLTTRNPFRYNKYSVEEIIQANREASLDFRYVHDLAIQPTAIHLLKRMLSLSPKIRISSQEALRHVYLHNVDEQTQPTRMRSCIQESLSSIQPHILQRKSYQ